jgi:hypothetical protein
MPKGDGQMPLTAIYGHMQLEQQMMEGIMHQPETMINVPSPGSVEQKEFQPLNTNITLDAQYMYYKRKSEMEGKQESGRTEQG